MEGVWWTRRIELRPNGKASSGVGVVGICAAEQQSHQPSMNEAMSQATIVSPAREKKAHGDVIYWASSDGSYSKHNVDVQILAVCERGEMLQR